MERHSELKIRYDPEIGRYVKKHVYTGEIHGKGLTDIFKSIGSKLFGKTAKKAATTVATKAATTAATKTGEHLGNKAGEKIVQLLSKKQPNQQTVQQTISKAVERPLTDLKLLKGLINSFSGGKMRKR